MLDSTVSDIHLSESQLDNSMVFPGPRRISNSDLENATALLERCKKLNKSDFMVCLDGEFFRGRRETRAVDCVWYHLRRMPPNPPTLEDLPTQLPKVLAGMMMSKSLQTGGLVYIAGAPGQGKTTTASGLLVSRLRKFGGFGYTLEDPPEMPLNGWHKDGYCRQTWVAGDNIADWAESFRGVLRSQPAGTSTMLYVGEVRDAESAQAMLRAASNGFLVIATGFGSDIVSGLDALVQLAGGGESTLSTLASLIRLVVHQRIVDGRLIATFLGSINGRTSVAAKLRTGSLNQVISDVQFQANQAMLGLDVFEEQQKV